MFVYAQQNRATGAVGLNISIPVRQGDHKVPHNVRLFDSLQHHVISTNRTEYQVGGQEHECKASSCLVGGKYMVALEREKNI